MEWAASCVCSRIVGASRYTCICVPPLPDKSFNTKFGETADVKRRANLERWLRRIMAHPVLRQVCRTCKRTL